MTFYRRAGILPAKHLTAMRNSTGSLYYEELFSAEGFSGVSSLLYRINPPNSVTRIEPLATVDMSVWDPHVTRSHLLDVPRYKPTGDFVSGRRPVLLSDDIVYSIANVSKGMNDFYRNSYNDEVIVVAKGSARLLTSFGAIDCRPLDFVYIPRGTTVQWQPAGDESHQIVTLETRTPVAPPARFRSSVGQFLERAPYHERDLRGPELQDPVDRKGEFRIAVKTGQTLSSYCVNRHPFDVVGWDGYVYPYALNLRDYEPISGRLHQMPDMYQVFEAEGVAICATLPTRQADHPDAAPAQPFHFNMDCDEVFFRLESTVPSKDFRLGKITWQPRAFPHGPAPGFESQPRATHSSMFGLMVDVVKPLRLAKVAEELDDPSFITAFSAVS